MNAAAEDGTTCDHQTSVLIVLASPESDERFAVPLRDQGYRVASLPAWDMAVGLLRHVRFDLVFVDEVALAASASSSRDLAGATPVVPVTTEPSVRRTDAVALGVRTLLDAAAKPDEIVSVAHRLLGRSSEKPIRITCCLEQSPRGSSSVSVSLLALPDSVECREWIVAK